MKPPVEFKIMMVRECALESPIVDTPESAAAYWRTHIVQAPWYDPMKEAFVVLALNTRRRLLGHNLVALGTLDTCTVHPREVFRPVICLSASVLILAHNHPSGDPTPSEADIRVTRDLIRASQLLKMEILDHIIMGENHVSLRELGYFFYA